MQAPPEFYNVANIQSYSTPSLNQSTGGSSEISLADIPPLSTHQQLVLNIIFPYENEWSYFSTRFDEAAIENTGIPIPRSPSNKINK